MKIVKICQNCLRDNLEDLIEISSPGQHTNSILMNPRVGDWLLMIKRATKKGILVLYQAR